MSRKRIFDILVTVMAVPTWLPTLILCGLALLITNGPPVFYRSWRRVYLTKTKRLLKFRVMKRNSDKIANRDTIPINGQRFLNIPLDSPLYTRVGRFLERFQLTELPQLLHVLAGSMSLVGNRPLPENVIAALREVFPFVEDRFLAKCGLTGPTQLCGRETLTDDVRLRLEVAYCRICVERYTFRLDFMLLLLTVLRSFRLIRPMSAEAVEAMMIRYAGHPDVRAAEAPILKARPVAQRIPTPVRTSLSTASFGQEEA